MSATSDTPHSSIKETRCRACGQPIIPFEEICPLCGAEHPSDEFLGRTLRGNIAIESILGIGGMGVVYKGVETHLERPVAVKVLHSSGQLTARNIDYFMREARLLSRLRHPHLVSVLDFGQEQDGTLFLVLEFIPGNSLEALLERGEPFSFARSVRLMLQILSALEEVHRHEIVHRDLKPGNILLEQVAGQGDFAKVLDFGIAKMLGSQDANGVDPFHTELGTAVGTPQYMSPEQAQGLELDGRSDIYSAGLVLYELLTQTQPHSGSNVFEIMMRKVGEDVPPPSTRRPELQIPAILDEICRRALTRHPRDRYPDVVSFREDLEEALRQLSQHPDLGRPSRRQRSTSPGLSTQEAAGAATATLLAVRIGVAGDTHGGQQMQAARVEAALAWLAPAVQRAGGLLGKPRGEVVVARFLDNPSGSSLVRAATVALQLKEEALRKLAFARLRMGLVRGSANEQSPDQERARALAATANPNQLLADSEQCAALRAVIRVEEQGGALALLEPLRMDRSSAGLSQLPATSPPQGPPEGALPGRQKQALALHNAARALLREQPGGALLLLGPEGAGKSHALEFVRRMARAAGLPVLEGHASEYLLDRPLRPLFDVAFQAIGVEEAQALHAGQLTPERLRQGLRMLGLPEKTCGDLLEQYIAGTDDDPWVMFAGRGQAIPYGTLRRARHLFPFQERRLVFTGAMCALLERITEAGSAVVILEDLDRADACTLACLPGLCELSRKAPVLLLGTSNRADIDGLQGFSTLTFEDFDPAARQRFLAELVQADHTGWRPQAGALPEAGRLAEALAASQGSPMYLTRWLRRPGQEAPPADLEALVAAQAAALPGRFRRLLLIAAVLGEYFEERVLEELFPKSKALSAALEGAAADGWLARCDHEPGLWRFVNPQLRRAIYKAIPHEERRRYHINLLEGLQKGPPSSRKLLLEAIHARRAGDHPRTLACHSALGDRFSLAGETQRALDFYLLALKAIDKAPRDPQAAAQQEELRLKIADAMIQTGQGARALTLLRHPQPRGVANQLRAAALVVRAHAANRDLKAALQSGQEALAAPNAKDSVHAVELLELLADIASREKQYNEAIALLDQGQRTLARTRAELPDDLLHLTWRLWLTRAVFYARAGKSEESEAALAESLQQAIQTQDAAGITQICHALVSVALRRKQPQAVLETCQRALEHPDIAFHPGQRVQMLQNLSRLYQASHLHEHAQALLAEARVLAVTTGWVEAARDIHSPPDTRGYSGRHSNS